MADRLTDEERAAIEVAIAVRGVGVCKATTPKPRAEYPQRVSMGVVTRAQPFTRAQSKPTRGPMPVQALLEWAFRREGVSLELPDRRTIDERGSGFGMEFVLMERARLGGVRIDTSIGRSEPHEDAETVAAIVANLSGMHGGLMMAIRVAEFARAGMAPDWLPGPAPRYQPGEWKTNRHGERARSEVVEVFKYDHRGRDIEFESRACPVSLQPDPRKLAVSRQAYVDWWLALSQIRRNLKACGMLREVGVTDVMPPRQPWDEPMEAMEKRLRRASRLPDPGRWADCS